MEGTRKSTDIIKLFDENKYLKICAPMVRYSKLQFRNLVREYGCDLAYTPMILADSFCLSEKARKSEFSTNQEDGPLIAQFASNTIYDFVGAANLIAPYCDGVGLNCGCPQRWAKQLGLGCIMLEKPELVSSMVKECRNRIPKPFTVSVKMRILKDLKKTIEICKQLEKAGVSFLSVHARTSIHLTGEINVDALKLIVENVSCPIVANGGVKNLQECEELHQKTSCKGIMVANGLLTNPTLFSGSNETTLDCVQKWLDICYNSTVHKYDLKTDLSIDKSTHLTYQCFHHHLVFMFEKILPKWKRRIFNNLQKFSDVLQFLEDEFHLTPQLFDSDKFKRRDIVDCCYADRNDVYCSLKESCNVVDCKNVSYNYDENNGSFFNNKIIDDDEDCGLNDIFIEHG